VVSAAPAPDVMPEFRELFMLEPVFMLESVFMLEPEFVFDPVVPDVVEVVSRFIVEPVFVVL
jgi:hypothetical protein